MSDRTANGYTSTDETAELRAQLSALMDAFNDQAAENERLTKERDAIDKSDTEWRNEAWKHRATIERLRAALDRIGRNGPVSFEGAGDGTGQHFLLTYDCPTPEDQPHAIANTALTGKEQE